MRIEHVAVWTRNVERLRTFYERYFRARAGPLYRSTTHAGFSSYFLTFPDGGSRLELMSLPALEGRSSEPAAGYAHISLSVGSREAVESLTARMRADGIRVLSDPRQTGDGYYESVVADPDGNAVEITV